MVIWPFFAALLIFHLIWYAVSYFQTRKPLPDEADVAKFRKAHADILDLDSVKGVMEEVYIEANGFSLHLDIFPNGIGYPAIVFIPGTSVYARHYIGFMYAMCEAGFNVIGFDPRGHGRSSGRRGDYTINTIVEDALAVVAYARKRYQSKVAVVGSSQGGIAAFYAAAKEDRLAAAVCHNIADLNGRQNQVLSRIRVPWWMTPAARFVLWMYGSFVIPVGLYLDLSGEYLNNGINVAEYLRKDPLCVNWNTVRALNALLKTRMAKPVEAIKVPVMVVHSEHDSIFPRQYVASIYERLTCRKRFYFILNRGHLVMINDVPEIAPDIAAWLHEMMALPCENG